MLGERSPVANHGESRTNLPAVSASLTLISTQLELRVEQKAGAMHARKITGTLTCY